MSKYAHPKAFVAKIRRVERDLRELGDSFESWVAEREKKQEKIRVDDEKGSMSPLGVKIMKYISDKRPTRLGLGEKFKNIPRLNEEIPLLVREERIRLVGDRFYVFER